MLRLVIAGSGLLGLFGCTSGDGQLEPDTSGSTSGSASDATTHSSADSSMTSETSDASTQDTGLGESTRDDLGLPRARGIGIRTITIDQGVRRILVLDGVEVDRAPDQPRVLASRPAMLRAFYELDDDFERRTIYAVLQVQRPDGSMTEYDQVIEAVRRNCALRSRLECEYRNVNSGFSWTLSAEDMVPGTQFRIDLYEAAPGFEDRPLTRDPSYPDEGFASLSVEDTYMKLRVKVFPVEDNDTPPCPVAPDLQRPVETADGRTVSLLEYLEERLAAMSPVDEVELIEGPRLQLTPNIVLDQTGTLLLDLLQRQRLIDEAPPGWYYYALVSGCSSEPEFLGLADVADPTKDTAMFRVAWGLYLEDNLPATADTLVHELGHNQGLGHAACTGIEPGVDPTYVDHPEGDTEAWGTDVFSSPPVIRAPSSHDYMTYCPDKWVSAWTWNKVESYVETISRWELEASDASERAPVLVGTVWPDGDARWNVGRARVPSAWVSPHQRVVFRADDGTTRSVPAAVRTWGHTSALNVIAPIPTDIDPKALRAEWIDEDTARVVPITDARLAL